MKLKFCSCRMCKLGKKRYGNPKRVTCLKRAYRHKVKQMIKQMIKQGKYEEELPVAIPVPHTD